MRHLVETIQALVSLKPSFIAIDGPCGGGKSTLARTLRDLFVDAEVYHMDDFFLTPQMAAPERLSIPGENVDHERFLRELLLPLLERKTFTYRKYDCQTGSFVPRQSEPARLSIIEGSYSLHRSLRDHYDLKVFLHVDAQTQAQRILNRSGERMATRFFEEWIPMENAYFAAENIRAICDVIIEG